MSKKVGIMGGTFNPIHNGHLKIAEIAMRGLELDEVRFIPTGDSPHKRVRLAACYRLDMVRLGIEGMCGFTVSDMEIQRGGTSYTYQTLAQLNHDEPNSRLFFIVGADMLRDLVHWRSPDEILKRAALAAVPRPGEDMSATIAAAQKLREDFCAEVYLLSRHGPNISSTSIRDMVRAGEDISALVPPKVRDYILTNKLYTVMEKTNDA